MRKSSHEQEYIEDGLLSEAEYLAKYNHMVFDGKLTQEYLRMRWHWMHGTATWQEVANAYMKTPVGIKSLKN